MLQMFADTLQQNIRHDQGIWIARYGEEELRNNQGVTGLLGIHNKE